MRKGKLQQSVLVRSVFKMLGQKREDAAGPAVGRGVSAFAGEKETQVFSCAPVLVKDPEDAVLAVCRVCNSVAAAAVAAHECGHAVQHAREYAPLKMRSALVPVVSFSSQWAMWVIIAGMLLLNTYPALFWIGIGMIAVSAVFSLITLPVEYNASARAMEWLTGSYTLKGEQAAQAKEALAWAARTYLVAALSAVVTLIYYIGIARRQ